jgi:hypothetical protein
MKVRSAWRVRLTWDQESFEGAELSGLLDTAEGRLAELTVLAELIQTTTRGDNLDMLPTLRERARELLRFGDASLGSSRDRSDDVNAT